MNSRGYAAWGVEALRLGGTVRYLVFFVISLKTRVAEIAGTRVDPDGDWMKQVARNLTDSANGFLRSAKYLIHDRDPLFTEAFKAILGERGVKCVKIPAQSPNCHPHAERFVKTIRYECLNQLIFFGERPSRHVVKEFMAHYHPERFHQGVGGQLIERPVTPRWNVELLLPRSSLSRDDEFPDSTPSGVR